MGQRQVREQRPCPVCHGTGRTMMGACTVCTGRGEIGDFKFTVEGEAAEVARVSQEYIKHGFKNMPQRSAGKSGFLSEHWQQVTAFSCGILFVVVMLGIAIAIPNPTATQWFVFRVVLALAAAGIGAVIPGLIVVNVSKIVRAGGAIALFVLVYMLNPPQLVSTPPSASIHQTTGGTISPAVVSGGDVVIGGDKPSDKSKEPK
jgi:hypothetical protein